MTVGFLSPVKELLIPTSNFVSEDCTKICLLPFSRAQLPTHTRIS